MNHLVILLFLIGSPVIISNLGHGIFHGKVKSVTYTNSQITWDSIGAKVKIVNSDYTLYDSVGKMMLQEQTMGYASSWTKSSYTYNTKGLLIEKKTYRLLAKTNDTILVAYHIYTYDSIGKRAKRDSVVDSYPVYKTIMVNGEEHDSIMLIPSKPGIPFADSTISNIKTLKSNIYDKKGHLIHAEGINNKYDKKGTLRVHEIMRNGQWKEVFKYNSKGLLTDYFVYSSDGKINRRYTYSTVKHGISTANEYNKDGVVTEKTISKYMYDKVGNWIVDSIFTNDTLTHVEKLKFEYY